MTLRKLEFNIISSDNSNLFDALKKLMKKKENKFKVLRLLCLLSALNGGLLDKLTNVNYDKYKEEFI
jgi:hypothetical protein